MVFGNEMDFDLSRLLHLIADTPSYRRLIEDWRQGKVAGVVALDAAKPYAIAALYRDLRVPLLVVTAGPEEAGKIHEQLQAWGTSTAKLFPEPDALPYERIVTDTSTEMERVRVLSALANCGDGGGQAPLIVASAPALMSKTAAYDDFAGTCHILRPGTEVEPLRLLARWETMGYERESVVELPGSVARRGGIIDVYPPTSDLPARLEFFGNSIESIRLFDPISQRSVKAIASLEVGPATELLAPFVNGKNDLKRVLEAIDLSSCNAEEKERFREDTGLIQEGQRPRDRYFYGALFNGESLLDFLPKNGLIILDDPRNIELTVGELDSEASQLRSDKMERGELPRNFPRPYFAWAELAAKLGDRSALSFAAWDAEERHTRLDFTSPPGFAGQLPQFIDKVKGLLGEKRRVIVVSHQASRLSELFNENDLIAVPVTTLEHVPLPGALALVQGSLAEGWVLPPDTYLFTDAEIFGFVKQRRLVKKRPVAHHKLLGELVPGQYVVHVEHGIARFAGVTTMGVSGREKEYLVLQYAAGDKLYVPTDQIDRVSRYVGAGDRPPALTRLGTQEWVRTKQKVKEAAEKLARELLALYASREVVPGHAFSRDTVWQQELEASFPYVETPDQLEAQMEVKEDMQKLKPMDRLVCGDVGYGKTEVAVRAAFKAVIDGKQVAVLVPTTVLAEQHYITFGQRMKAFPVRIEVLSRFRSHKEQKVVIEGLASGGVDICIGTHRLLQKDVVFKDLGLLVIDEEQRFGVAHKEYLKKMRQEVDVLTLSATPIPRTLHMSLVGVRDMSTMETPPEDRLPIKTYVAEYNDRVVREAILRELERNGQVFFVHNRVQSIAMIAAKLKEMVPEAKIAVGHGQMPEERLEEVMASFARGESNVLVCSTIIESGLDMPNVNTLIVNQADKFGLTQLYQLRGRVGRGANFGYAYFLYDRGKRLTPTAQKRLRTIYEATELGAGFTIAMKDLEIRGAGNLLGSRQSGYISAIGFDLYTRLLSEAVEELKAKRAGAEPEPRRLPPPSIDLPLAAFIPEEYVVDLGTRVALYQKLVKLDRVEAVDDMAKELNDRFGPPPQEVKNLLYAVRVKLLGAWAGIESINTEDGQVVIRRFQGLPFNRQKLGPVRDGIRVGNTQIALNPKRLGKDWPKVLEEVLGKVG